MEIEVEQSTFKGRPVLKIWGLDEEGNRNGEYPIITVGRKKAKALVQAIESLKAFAQEGE